MFENQKTCSAWSNMTKRVLHGIARAGRSGLTVNVSVDRRGLNKLRPGHRYTMATSYDGRGPCSEKIASRNED